MFSSQTRNSSHYEPGLVRKLETTRGLIGIILLLTFVLIIPLMVRVGNAPLQ